MLSALFLSFIVAWFECVIVAMGLFLTSLELYDDEVSGLC